MTGRVNAIDPIDEIRAALRRSTRDQLATRALTSGGRWADQDSAGKP